MSTAQPWRAKTASQIRTAAVEAVEIAAVAYLEHPEQEPALTAILTAAHSHGLTVTDLAAASGLDDTFIRRLLDQGAAR